MIHWVSNSMQRPWLALALLLAAVLAPTICALWLMLEAMESGRLAVYERLRQAHAFEAEEAAEKLDVWLASMVERAAQGPVEAAEYFAWVAREGIADAGLKMDPGASRPIYPGGETALPRDPVDSAAWQEAQRREFQARDLAGAAQLYAEITTNATGAERLRARLAEARVRETPPAYEESLRLLREEFTLDTYANAETTDEKSLRLSGLYRIHELSRVQGGSNAGLDAVKTALADYRPPCIPAGQRCMLLRQASISSDPLMGKLLEAEQLGGEFAERAAALPEAPGVCVPSTLRGVYMMDVPVDHALLLLRAGTIAAQVETIVNGPALILSGEYLQRQKSYHLALRPAGTPATSDVLPLNVWNARLQSMQWVVVFPGPILEQDHNTRMLVYAWITVLVLLGASCLALLAGYAVFRQVRLAGLKNELISVIAHELKTPLASMRVLVETLRAGRAGGEREQQEYLELIARENLRLSHLVENFLTFSRLEQGRSVFHFEPLDAGAVIRQAVDTVADRIGAPGCSLVLELPEDLPFIRGDHNALVTALLNLLDNAWKYSGEEKRVVVRVVGEEAGVRIDVSDNGIGLDRRAAQRVFERFYQADRSLTGHAGGCGLGLSIVRFIVEAHGGTVMAEGEPGKGATFTLRLPADQGKA